MVGIYEILQKIGFDWQVALANLINFLIILFLLKKFAFKPIGKIIKDRQDRIDDGLTKAQEADARLKEVDAMAVGIIKNAKNESVAIVEKAKQNAAILDDRIQKEAERKKIEIQNRLEVDYRRQSEAMNRSVEDSAAMLVKKFIIKAVELDADAVDEALIHKALSKVRELKS